MSAVLKEAPQLEPMREEELDEVMAIETSIYSHPWTRGNFAGSLRAAYQCRTWRLDGALVGYFVLAVAAGEAHLLNLSIAPGSQRRGFGSALLSQALACARELGARRMFLEVRPSNHAAQGLYRRSGFRRIGVRRGYYPAREGREDALVLAREL